MTFSIRKKIFFVILLFLITSLASLFIIGGLIISDFRRYAEGSTEDRVYWLTTKLESRYEREGKFSPASTEDVVLTALLLGFECRIFDSKDKLITETQTALDNALPLTKRRISHQIEKLKNGASSNSFIEYPLFLANQEIGELHLRFIGEGRTERFLSRSGLFLAGGLLIAILGSIALSAVLTSNILAPIARLHRGVKAMANGEKHIIQNVSSADELGELAKAFNAMSKALERKENVRKTSISKFAHELRTPLTVMQGELEGMTDGIIPMDKERLDSLKEEVERLKHMSKALENLYRIERESENLSVIKCEIGVLARNVIRRFETRCREKNIFIKYSGDDLEIETDSAKLIQILINLVANAVEATETGGITLSAGKEEKGVFIAVADTGKGIKEADLPFVFELFYGNTEGGMGLGLAIVKELIDAIGGTIDVKSVPEQGSTFKIYFPVS